MCNFCYNNRCKITDRLCMGREKDIVECPYSSQLSDAYSSLRDAINPNWKDD